MSIFGTLLGTDDSDREPAETADLPPSAPRGKVAERILAAELLQELREIRASMTEFGERLTTGTVNHVLGVETRMFPSTGYISRSYGGAMGSVEVRALGAHDVTVSAGESPGSSVPTIGVGVYVVPAGTAALVNVAGRGFTLWGTSGETVSYQAFTTGGQARPSLGAVDGGGA
jgi:hypothetical protein